MQLVLHVVWHVHKIQSINNAVIIIHNKFKPVPYHLNIIGQMKHCNNPKYNRYYVIVVLLECT